MSGTVTGRFLMDIRIIKTDEQYQEYLNEVGRLAAEDPDPASAEGARLELLAKLVEDYEKGRFPFSKPDPVDALLFRMEQQNLRQKDIADLLGGKNRASEILARKRPLSLAMIRSLHERLGIPASLLIREPDSERRQETLLAEPSEFDAALDLIMNRGWSKSKSEAAHLWQRLVSERPGTPAFLKHTMTFGRNNKTNLVNVWLWLARIRAVADAQREVHARFDKAALNDELIHYVTRLSWLPDGPLAAIRRSRHPRRDRAASAGDSPGRRRDALKRRHTGDRLDAPRGSVGQLLVHAHPRVGARLEASDPGRRARDCG
jgi:HTH-type transcriptional regulator/antitoxin HigA